MGTARDRELPLDVLPRGGGRVKPTRKYEAKGDPAETRRRVRFVMMLLAQGKSRAYIHEFFRNNYQLTVRTAERYIARARKKMVDDVDLPKEELRAISVACYANILDDETATNKDKISARTRMDRLLGLEAPIKVAHTDSLGNDPLREAARGMTDEELYKARERLAQIATGGGEGAGGN
jgi:hypothetical protein